jgi:hypothetical protein
MGESSMQIDEIDFTLNRLISPTTLASLSKHECTFLSKDGQLTMHQWESVDKYMDKLATYHERFNNHMPAALRKQLLKEIQGSGK